MQVTKVDIYLEDEKNNSIPQIRISKSVWPLLPVGLISGQSKNSFYNNLSDHFPEHHEAGKWFYMRF